ncbi:MAG: hypothetical protein LBT44_04330 [Clostridiales bacterium]|jgi:hypothetical protein|nr:hypothetical protein [Clostridiales bacterium]
MQAQKMLYGDDGKLYLVNQKNNIIAQADSFSGHLFEKTTAVPSRFLNIEIPTGYAVQLVLHGVTIVDFDELERMKRDLNNGKRPILHFQGSLKRRDELHQRIILHDLVQRGTVDVSGLEQGCIDVWTFWVNDPKALQYFE